MLFCCTKHFYLITFNSDRKLTSWIKLCHRFSRGGMMNNGAKNTKVLNSSSKFYNPMLNSTACDDSLLTCHRIWPWHNQRSAVVCDWSIHRWCHDGCCPSCGARPHLGFTRHRRLLWGDGNAGRMSATPALAPYTRTTIFRPLQTRATALFILTGTGDCCYRMERKREMKVNEVWAGEGPDINGKDTRGENATEGQARTSRKRKQELTIKGSFGETVNKQWS